MKTNPLLKLALELGPLAIFFAVNASRGIFAGTAAFMGATVLALGVSYVIHRTVPIMPLVTAVFVLVFGGLTLYLANDLFIKIKPTLVNLTFAGILIFGLLTRRIFLKLILEAVVQLTERGWLVLTRAWIGFLLFLAAANEVVWRNASTEFWIAFKAFGVMPMTMLFSVVSLIPVMQRYAIPTPDQGDDPRPNPDPVDKA
ncbi:MAG: septation protein A [Rhodospirillaceae bacterium]|nr:septation protein A [Rhodospirillaceae bacterium]